MIPVDFQHFLSDIFNSNFRLALTTSEDDFFEFHDKGSMEKEDINLSQFYILTIVSPAFRVFILLHFSQNEITKQYVAKRLGMPLSSMEEHHHYDFISEISNIFCGSIKRDLNVASPTLGMSTPNLLQNRSIHYIHRMPIDYHTHACAMHNQQTLFYASLYISVSGEIHYEAGGSHNDAVSSGELEFF